MNSDLDELLNRFKEVAEGRPVPRPEARYRTYAITNFRGGIGKSTISFNLAYEVSRKNKSLFIDLCPQCNFSQSLLGDNGSLPGHTVYDALLPKVMAGAPSVAFDDLPIVRPLRVGMAPTLSQVRKSYFYFRVCFTRS
jgi:chromosome partitioning protein